MTKRYEINVDFLSYSEMFPHFHDSQIMLYENISEAYRVAVVVQQVKLPPESASFSPGPLISDPAFC